MQGYDLDDRPRRFGEDLKSFSGEEDADGAAAAASGAGKGEIKVISLDDVVDCRRVAI